MEDQQSAPRATDARAVVREGLRRTVAAHGEPPDAAAGATAWRNRLLDETGSDHRGLVQLLLRVRADGLAAAAAARLLGARDVRAGHTCAARRRAGRPP